MSNHTGTIRRVIAPAVLAAGALAAAFVAPGCGEDSPFCCDEGDFQVGGTISAEAGYSAEVKVALQAVADIAGIASASVDDLTTACRAIATDLEAPEAERKGADSIENKTDRMQTMCSLAVSAIGTFKAKAQGEITLDIQEPQCSANVSAKANCQAGCSGSAECDVKANPPVCEGGKLEVSCKGSCTAEAGASVSCTGQCTGSCEGKCTAEGGVECQGKCDGTCSASAEGNGDGIQADGTCQGVCNGTCEVTAPSASCSGTCEGSCSASCEATAGAAVKCDGSCDGEFEPLRCEGGELKGGCRVDAKCEANCDASVKAKAECTPPRIALTFSGAADAQAAGKLKAVLEANLAVVASLKARLGGVLGAVGTVAANVDEEFLADIKVACIPVIISAVDGARADIQASVEASVSIIGAI